MLQNLLKLPQWLGFVLILGFITLGSTLTVYSPLYANGLINVVIPILILIFFKSEFFEKLKLGTLTIGRILVVFTVLGIFPHEWLVPAIAWLMRVNILEAALTDYKNKSYFNVISGLALLGSSFILTGSWTGTYYLTDAPGAAMLLWALAYTLWNWDFVIYEFKQPVGLYHAAVLSAPLLFIVLIREPGFWLILRANSLTFAGILQITGKRHIEQYFTNYSFGKIILWLKSRTVQATLAAVNVILCTAAFILY